MAVGSIAFRGLQVGAVALPIYYVVKLVQYIKDGKIEKYTADIWMEPLYVYGIAQALKAIAFTFIAAARGTTEVSRRKFDNMFVPIQGVYSLFFITLLLLKEFFPDS